MTERFSIMSSSLGRYTVFDGENGKPLDSRKVENLLNKQHEKNQSVKDILNELKSIDGFWDSALLLGVVTSIANVVGVDLE